MIYSQTSREPEYVPFIYRLELASITNLIDFGLTQPMIYCTRGKHANQYTIDAYYLEEDVS
jgi:hypothetical protein